MNGGLGRPGVSQKGASFPPPLQPSLLAGPAGCSHLVVGRLWSCKEPVQGLLLPQFPHWTTGLYWISLSLSIYICASVLFLVFSNHSECVLETSSSVSPCFCHLKYFLWIILTTLLIGKTTLYRIQKMCREERAPGRIFLNLCASAPCPPLLALSAALWAGTAPCLGPGSAVEGRWRGRKGSECGLRAACQPPC